MTAKEINTALYFNYPNWEYKLFNQFLFTWESDFVGQTASGYWVEIETKLSRSDFFADFQKRDKHKLLKTNFEKLPGIVYNHGTNSYLGDLWGYYNEYRLSVQYDNIAPKYEYENRRHFMPTRNGYFVNDYGRVSLQHIKKELRTRNTRITVKLTEQVLCPHKLFYACPPGLLKANDMPRYAGLLWVNETAEVETVKQAPFLHKRTIDLTAALLKKYYNYYKYKVNFDEKLKLNGQGSDV